MVRKHLLRADRLRRIPPQFSWLDQRLMREAGYCGGSTIVGDYVRTVRPRSAPAFLTLAFALGECA
ncbi:MAG: hypothetical protein ACR2RB_16350 [Gammaproteobacteria bacterium]